MLKIAYPRVWKGIGGRVYETSSERVQLVAVRTRELHDRPAESCPFKKKLRPTRSAIEHVSFTPSARLWMAVIEPAERHLD